MNLDLTALDAADWTLAGEGGTSLVLRNGLGSVLRLRKLGTDLDRCATLAAIDKELWQPLLGTALSGAASTLLAYEAALRRLLRVPAVSASVCCLPLSFARAVELRHGIVLARNAAGCFEALLSVDACFDTTAVLTASNALPAPVFTVELKPKAGFLPVSLTVDQASPKLVLSRFALHARLRLDARDVSQCSGYCPLELFSAGVSGARSALRQLLACPKNNLSISRNGVHMFGSAGLKNSRIGRVRIRAMRLPFY